MKRKIMFNTRSIVLFGFALTFAPSVLSGCGSHPSAPLKTTNIGDKSVSVPPLGGLFREVASEAGVTYRFRPPGTRPLTILGTIGNGGAFLDYDRDGNLDILLVGQTLVLYRGNGKGSFTETTQAVGMDKLRGHFLGCAVGDWDNDGFADLYLTAYRGGVLLRNEAGKRFRDVTAAAGIKAQPWGTSASFGDIDGDGRLDLFICNYVQFSPNTQPQLCDYAGQPSACGPRFYSPQRSTLYRNAGEGKFTDVTTVWNVQSANGKGLGIGIADFEGKGRQSIAIANDEMAGDLLHHQGKTFRNIGDTSSTGFDASGNIHGGMGVDWGDYNNDSKLDLIVATFQHEAKCVYRNEGEGLFTESSSMLGLGSAMPYVAFGVKFFDYDNDGFLDLILANGHVQDNIEKVDKHATYLQSTQLFHNVGGNGFEEKSEVAGEAFRRKIMGRGLAIGDYDNDGRVDALVIDGEGTPLLLHNETPQAGHWLLCRLEGKRSNRMGIGANLEIRAGGKTLLRRCATDGSYLSASDARVHIGLGNALTADITVSWVGSTKTTYTNIPADRVVTLREGSPTPQFAAR